MSGTINDQTLGLGILLHLTRRVRDAASAEEVGFIAVNESKQILPYRQAALWLERRGVFAVSGIPEPDPGAPYIQWLTSVFRELRSGSGCRAVTPDQLSPSLAGAWDDWLPAHAAVVPLTAGNGASLGMLLFSRDEQWQEHELALATELAAIYRHGLAPFFPKGVGQGIGTFLAGTWGRIALAGLALGALCIPVRLSVQAPAEVVPKDPFVVRSPLDGVIDRFNVRPNETVRQDQLLFEFDSTALRAKLGIASKAYEVASEEYRQSAQMALTDDKSRAEIAPKLGRMAEKGTELSYSRQLFRRLGVRAPRPGIAVFADQNDWIGKNVSIGERVLVIADPARAEMLIQLPVADAIRLDLGTPVRLYLATDPQTPLAGTLRYASYKPELNPAGFAAYRLKADFGPGVAPPRIGLTGTVRIYGEKVSLGYLIFRRPLTVLRQRLGW
jgi:hypothetical protein